LRLSHSCPQTLAKNDPRALGNGDPLAEQRETQ
jgi:hypothetical protein